MRLARLLSSTGLLFLAAPLLSGCWGRVDGSETPTGMAGAPAGPASPPAAPPPDGGGNQPDAGAAPVDATGPDRAPAPAPAPARPPDGSTPVADASPSAADAGADATADPAGAALVFDTTRLHRIEIRVDQMHLAQLEMDQENRVPCTLVYDGIELPMTGIRKKGGPGSLRPLSGKPGFSVKFNQFVKGQKLHGLSKMSLNNAVQDSSFLAEHMAYEMVRRAGGAAPLTAHGLITFNGRPLGLFVLREAYNDDFVARTFGKVNVGGNFYEGGEFVGSPNSPELKDEKEEMRSREDLRQVSRLINTTPDGQWVAAVDARVDLESFFIGWAVESLVDHWDGYFFGPHNHYLYHHPGTDKIVFLVAGMDSIFGRIRDPRLDPKVLLASKIMQFPATRTRFRERLQQIVRTFDLPGMTARIDQAARNVRSHQPTDPATRADFASFEASLGEMKSDMTAIRAWTVPVF
jgi:spore coat protein H